MAFEHINDNSNEDSGSFEDVFFVEIEGQDTIEEGKKYYSSLFLPTSSQTIIDAEHEARLDYVRVSMAPIEIEDCKRVPLFEELTFEPLNLYELNYLATRIGSFNESELAVYNALLPKIVKENNMISVRDAINLTYSIDDVPVMSHVTNDADLGDMLLDTDVLPEYSGLPESVINMLDSKKVGKQYREKVGGVFSGDFYVEPSEFKLKQVYKDMLSADVRIEGFVFRLVMKDSHDVPFTVHLPFEEAEREYLDSLKEKEFQIVDYRTAIPQLSIVFGNSWNYRSVSLEDIYHLSNIANAYLNFDDNREMTFMAALEAASKKSELDIDTTKRIISTIGDYKLDTLCIYPNDFVAKFIGKHMDNDFPEEYLKHMCTSELTAIVLNAAEGSYSPYGIVYKTDPDILLNENEQPFFQLMEVCGKQVLFTEGRIKPNDIPEGLFKYEFRAGAEYVYATLEEKVGVDFSGTILSKEPFELGPDEYIDFEKQAPDDYPDIVSDEITVEDYMNGDIGESEGMELC